MPYTDVAETRIYWEEQGSGPPLLLIMGLGYSLDMWHRTLPVAAAGYRTVVFDNRGVGRSGSPPGPYTMASMAADAAAVLDAAGIGRAHVFGISMGGMIAQELALTHPDRVDRLVLGCTSCGEGVRAEPAAVSLLMNRAGLSMLEAVDASVPFLYDPGTPRDRIEEDLEIRRRRCPSAEAYRAQLQAILGWSSHARLPKLSAPAMVIHGATDRLVPPENGRLTGARIVGARWRLLENAGHLFTTDQPEAAHREIFEFLGGG